MQDSGQEYKWKPAYHMSKQFKVINQANKLINKICGFSDLDKYIFQGFTIWLNSKLSFFKCSDFHGEFHGAWEELIILFPPAHPLLP